jgi:large subunit ribosomal protein L1
MSNLDTLKLSARTAKALEEAGVNTVEELKQLDESALKAIKGLGPKSQEEVINALNLGSKKESVESNEESDKSFAKAGKRSKKAADEADAEAEKQARKESEEEMVEEKRGPVPVTRSKLERRAKKYRKVNELITEDSYELKDAVELAIKTSTTNFDATVEMHINLNVNPAHADQNIRSTLVLPHGTGKSVRVAVFTNSEKQAEAKAAGADYVGEEDFIEKLKNEVIDFDVLIASPDVMAQLGRFAKLLGPKGLMPNPKSGTVAANLTPAIKEAKAGRIEYRVDSRGIVHVGIGKVSFGADKITENAQSLLDSISSNKPASIKGALIQRIAVSSTMGPGIRVKL